MTRVVRYRRYSHDEQEAGDSFTRQELACAQFAASKGWMITERLDDEGRSAFKNEHIEFGELGKFTRSVEAGAVPAGTILLAENLDRLSRRDTDEAMAWVWNLTSRGIRIALADNGMIYEANPDIGTFLTTALTFFRGNDESRRKSKLVRGAKQRLWEAAERREGRWTNLAARPPLWLQRNATCNDWIVDEHRAQIVRDIFQWSADGLGAPTIAKRLNALGEAPWGVWRKRDGWSRTAIRQLLVNPAVEGDFLPEKGMFEGRVIHGFYPRIVDADVVAKARGQQTARKRVAKARVSSGTVNLFAGMTFCGECGGTAFMTSQSKKGRSYRYLRCEAAGDGRPTGQSKLPCTNKLYYPYNAFEHTALDLCLDLALDDRFFQSTGELREAQIRQAELQKRIADKHAAIGRLLDALEAGAEDVMERLRLRREEVADLKRQLEQAEADIEQASGRVGAVEHLRRVNDIRDAARSDDALVSEQARGKLRQAFSAVIAGVDIERTDTGQKVFTVSFLGGVLGVRIGIDGEIVGGVSEALGKPLHEFLLPEERAVADPLIRRLEVRGNQTNK